MDSSETTKVSGLSSVKKQQVQSEKPVLLRNLWSRLGCDKGTAISWALKKVKKTDFGIKIVN